MALKLKAESNPRDTCYPLSAVFSDRLQRAEVDRTREAIANLSRIAWARPVIARLNKAGGIRPENMPLMFEVRFADELHSTGATAHYEFPTSPENSCPGMIGN